MDRTVSRLIALSFDRPATPRFEVRPPDVGDTESPTQYGWGFGWYPSDDETASVLKNPDSSETDTGPESLGDWDRFKSQTFVCHLSGSSRKASQRDAQPFVKTYAGRQWVLAHSGTLIDGFRDSLPLGVHPVFEPIGSTDSEHVFCWLLTALRAEGARTLSDYGWENLTHLFDVIGALGPASLILSDGRHVAARSDTNENASLCWARFTPPHENDRLDADDVSIDLQEDEAQATRTMAVISTRPLSDGEWSAIPGGHTLVLRTGSVAWQSFDDSVSTTTAGTPGDAPNAGMAHMNEQQAAVSASAAVAAAPVAEFVRPTERILTVTHASTYTYASPIEHSAHVFRLRPVHDDMQDRLEHSLELSVNGVRREFEDVFGNAASQVELTTPYEELSITSTSKVHLFAPPQLAQRSSSHRDRLPLVWMPWQRQMMSPYLLPVELPETELAELTEFAMSFVTRNDGDLYDTIFDINSTIYSDFDYVSGSTNLSTTPYDVYVNRKGVCQDFANLMICLARLLNVPARYRVGYIYTGGNYENKIQSDASHAWAELYLPWNGWRGFDPTNGCMAGLDHVRVACGRNYRDATPTTGTIYKGNAGGERLSVDVRVDEVVT